MNISLLYLINALHCKAARGQTRRGFINCLQNFIASFLYKIKITTLTNQLNFLFRRADLIIIRIV
jgi:hypothetical protein